MQAKLSETLDMVVSRPQTKAIVVTAMGSSTFFSPGADISEFSSASAVESIFTPETSRCYSLAEDGQKPVIAAIDGICFGGGLELVLSCSARTASPKSSFSLPELKLGIIPGLGGTQRLPRLVGFEKAVSMMLLSTVVSAREAESIGLIDIVAEDAVSAAVELANKVVIGSVPRTCTIDRRDRLEPEAKCTRIAGAFSARMVPKLSRGGHLMQYQALIDVALFGVVHGGRKGLVEEARVFMALVTSPHSLSLIHTFFASRGTTKINFPNDPNPGQDGDPAKSVGVIGGGFMGAGIATVMLMVDIPVCIKELNEKLAQGAKQRVKKNLGKHVSKLALLTVTTEYSKLSQVDIVIEAALENPILKQKIFSELQSVCKDGCILATNTSTLNLDLIGMGAPQAQREGRIIGAHFFSPAHKMPLLEVVRSESTSPNVIKDVIALGKKTKKTPVLVGNCPGFAVNRMYFPQSMVASFLVVDLDIDPYRIDRALEAFGIPMGPFRVLDLVGLDIGVAVGEVFETSYADRAVGTRSLVKSLLAAGRKGQKTGNGFYSYKAGTKMGVPDQNIIAPFLNEARSNLGMGYIQAMRKRAGNISDEDIVDMILLPCVNEGCRILAEGVATSTSDLDICSVMGMAFPAFKGGLMYWAQNKFGGSLGVKKRLETFHRLSDGFPLFKPSFPLTRSGMAVMPLGHVPNPTLFSGMADDVVVVSAYRTAVGRAGRGGFKDTLPEDLLIPLLKRILKETGVGLDEVGDIIAGNVLQRGDTGVVQLRVAEMIAGLSESVPVKTVNRLCSSGLQAIVDAAAAIQAGHYHIAIAGGIESMSMASMRNTELRPNPKVRRRVEASSCYLTMGQTSENVAERFGISRERQDRLAVCSHARAALVKLSGRQRHEIVPVKTQVKVIDTATKKVTGVKDIIVNTDEGVRLGVTMSTLAKLPAVFKKGGSTTPGNSSQLSDGAALVMLMKRSEAEARNLETLASLKAFSVLGVDPAVMGIGPAIAIPAVLQKAGLSVDDIDLFEINEAFGSQADYCIEKLSLNRDIVNVMGGAIAIGHPLGMTGARLSVSIIHELRRRNGRYGVVSMCIGSGMGAAAIYEINRARNPAKL
ncbi:unnamed protein product [Agarophyton chilense]